jgi:hypothetical protein
VEDVLMSVMDFVVFVTLDSWVIAVKKTTMIVGIIPV